MKLQEVTSQLRALGTTQNIKTYRRHGADDNVYGVSFADLKTMAKKIKVDHQLALDLWETQIVDARCLATMIIDCERIDETLAHRMLSGLHMSMLVDLLGGCVAKSPVAMTLIEDWIKSDQDSVRQCGYVALSVCLKNGSISDETASAFLQKIEKEIHESPNRSKHAMNAAVIAIGVHKPKLTDVAIQTAINIGTVKVDHGDTACKTPNAAAYIKKSVAAKKPKLKTNVT